MCCDLGRLQLAIASAGKRWSEEWRTRYRIAGHDVEEPVEDPVDDETFNRQARAALAALKRRAAH
jgi:hypothetical protein